MLKSSDSVDSQLDFESFSSKEIKCDSLNDETLTISTGQTSIFGTESDIEDIDLDRLIHERHVFVTSGANLEVEHDPNQQSKFRLLFSLLKNFIGVKDIVTLRISLPAQLLEPIGNLEYWNYNDRPDYLICIGDSDDPLERMFATIRWWFSKDLKYVKGKLIKPYNSILGEQFSCHWDVSEPRFDKKGNFIEQQETLNENDNNQKNYRVTCLTEQISHHPPVSAFCYHSEDKGITARGVDQLSARFTGTSVKIGPGEQNKGIYINLSKRGNEEYLLTHPVASVQGWLKASLYIVVGESCIITCPKTKLKAILEYKEERWLGKPKFAIEGKIFKYDPKNDDKKKLKIINENDVLAEITGSWRGQVHATRLDTNETKLLLDMEKIFPIPKQVKPISKQKPLESRNVWKPVTTALFQKDYTKATKEKQIIEERQRQKAAEYKSNKEFNAAYFKLPVIDGKPNLNDAGHSAMKQEHQFIF
nr:130_t:CDS:2 [Entrophospora candida]